MMETRPGWPQEMMRKAPASRVPFAADPSFSPAQTERDLLTGERAQSWQDPPCVGGSLCHCLGRDGWICRGVGEQLEV